MIFSEIHGAYYLTVSKILKAAVNGKLTDERCRKIIEKYAFSESILNIEPSLKNGKWPFLKEDGTTVIKNVPSFPLTELQRRWLKSVSLDPRVKLFGCSFDIPEDTEPLFTPDDYVVFDKYSDGDDFEDENYIRNFRIILDAVKNRKKLRIENISRKGKLNCVTVLPKFIEYSEKDDKFRVATGTKRKPAFINMGRIISCTAAMENDQISIFPFDRIPCSLTFELKNERNALERALLHFSHFKKEAVKTADKTYRITLEYDKSDETELVIRILSFGPLIKVTEPDSFIELIRERLIKQRECGI